VLADGISAAGGKLRHVPVSWAALWQAAACQYLSICGTEIRAQGRVENSIRVGSVGRGYFETRWPQFVPPESADQAIAKVLPFPAPTDCKSADECVPRDNCLKEVRATLEVDGIERKSK
jgi:hypothetical protein